MIVINLRIYYPALYRQDVFCEVPEQVKLLLDELKRYEHAQNERRRYHGAYWTFRGGYRIGAAAAILRGDIRKIVSAAGALRGYATASCKAAAADIRPFLSPDERNPDRSHREGERCCRFIFHRAGHPPSAKVLAQRLIEQRRALVRQYWRPLTIHNTVQSRVQPE